MKPGIITYTLLTLVFLMARAGATGIEDTTKKTFKLDVVVIDPGHGGKDFGTSVEGIKEKDIVLDIGLKLGQLIKENYSEIEVIYTRESDAFIPLNKRAEIANKNKAGLFISIHANYVGVKSVSGTETFVLGHHRSQDNLEIAKKENSVILLEDNYRTTYEGFDPNSSESYIMFELLQDEYLGQSLQMATFIQGRFKNGAKRNDRGVKQSGFLVLRETTMPSVLVETGFLSNKNEKDFLNSEEGRSDIAHAIFEAFGDYKRIIEEKSTYNLNVAENIVNQKPDNSPPAREETKSGSNKTQTSGKEKQVAGVTGKHTPAIKESETKKEAKSLSDEKSKEATAPIPVKADKENTPVWFTVQLVVTSKQVKLAPDNFKGETDVFVLQVGSNYKYYKGKYDTYNKAEAEKNRLRAKFNDAFIVAFEDGKTIPIKQAIGKTNQ